jgi:group I intron endonuclease
MAEEDYNDNCGVYLIVSPTNGRYVGSSKSLKKRFNRYKNYSCSRQSAILASLKKHGFESHKIVVLMYCSEKELLFWERVFGDIYLASANFKNGLNITLPGYGDVPQVRTQEFKDRISLAQKERFSKTSERLKTSEATKRGFTIEVKQRMSEIHTKRFENPELRKNRSEARKRYYENNPDAKAKASEITKQVMANRPELKQKAKETFSNYYKNNPEALIKEKKVINVETGEIHSGISKILDKVNVSRKVMQNRMRGYSVNPTPFRYLNTK